MFRRGGEGPMDWEYQNTTGPMGDSPFGDLARNTGMAGKKRDFSVFSSPPKNRPSHYPPSSPRKNGPWSTNNPLFATPRQLNDTGFNSSDPDTPNTPAQDDDSEAPTPENRGRANSNMAGRALTRPAAMVQAMDVDDNADSNLPHKGRRDSFFGRFKWGSNASRPLQQKMNDKKVQKKRNQLRLVRQHESRKAAFESDVTDSEGTPSRQTQLRPRGSRHVKSQARERDDVPPPIPPHTHGWGSTANAFFSFIDEHPDLPHTMSIYVQFFMNLFFACGVIYLVWGSWAAFQGDVKDRSQAATGVAMSEIHQCAQYYRENRCEPTQRVPALEQACVGWEQCMNRDPYAVGRGKMSARTFAEIFNGFVDEISYKTMFFAVLLALVFFGGSNIAFGFFRSKVTGPYAAQHHQQYVHPPPPPAPQRYPSNGYDQQQGFYPPYQALPGFEPGPSQVAERGGESPMRRWLLND